MLIILLIIIIIILIFVLHYYYLNDLNQNVAELIQKEDEINEKDLEYIHFKN